MAFLSIHEGKLQLENKIKMENTFFTHRKWDLNEIIFFNITFRWVMFIVSTTVAGSMSGRCAKENGRPHSYK